MAEAYCGLVADFEGDARKVVTVADREVVVFRVRGRFYALENRCLHSGGPVGEGLLIGKVEAVLGEDKAYLGERFSDDQLHLVCPWHGYEYDIETGQCAGNPNLRLRCYSVVESEGGIFVHT